MVVIIDRNDNRTRNTDIAAGDVRDHRPEDYSCESAEIKKNTLQYMIWKKCLDIKSNNLRLVNLHSS